MKKRLLCLILSLLLIVPALMMVGCVEDEDVEDEEEERLATTLTLMMVTNESTTPEAVEQVQDALNVITMSKYKTRVVLLTYTEDEYEKELNNRFTALEEAAAAEKAAAESKKAAEKEAKKRGEKIVKETTETTEAADETEYNEEGFLEIKYPEVEDNQIDIFYLSGVDNLYKYYKAERLALLDDVLNSSSKKLKDYIYPIFLDAGKVDGSTVAIVNNHTIGEYTMLLVNKELADKYYYAPDQFTSLSASYDSSDADQRSYVEEFIDEMAEKEPTYTPFLEKVDFWGFNTWGEGTSVFGSDMADYTTYGTSVAASIIFRNSKYRAHTLTMKRFEEAGYFSDDPENDTNFAAAVVKGSLSDKTKYEEDYYVTVLQQPTATNENVYDGMFCVNGYSDNSRIKRSMEIITLINTDPETRNLLQYGVVDVNYKLKSGKIVMLNDSYSMELVNTGNEFITTPTEDMPDDVWEIAKQQNIDSTSYSLLSYYFDEDDEKVFAEANETADKIYDIVNKATYAELVRESVLGGNDAYENPFDTAIEESKYVKNSNSITSTALDTSFAAKLADWFASNFPSSSSVG